MYNLRGRPVQFRRNACSISPVKVFSIKRSGCSTPPEYSADWSMTSSATDFKYLGASRLKENGTAVYFRMKTSVTSNKVDIKILGTTASHVTSWSELTNCTVKNGIARNYAKCTKGVYHSLHSTVYEDGYSRVTIAMTTAKVEKITGVWSADSTGTYTEATYY